MYIRHRMRIFPHSGEICAIDRTVLAEVFMHDMLLRAALDSMEFSGSLIDKKRWMKKANAFYSESHIFTGVDRENVMGVAGRLWKKCRDAEEWMKETGIPPSDAELWFPPFHREESVYDNPLEMTRPGRIEFGSGFVKVPGIGFMKCWNHAPGYGRRERCRIVHDGICWYIEWQVWRNERPRGAIIEKKDGKVSVTKLRNVQLG